MCVFVFVSGVLHVCVWSLSLFCCCCCVLLALCVVMCLFGRVFVEMICCLFVCACACMFLLDGVGGVDC